MFYGFDSYFFIFVVPQKILAMWASHMEKSTFK